MKTSRYTEAQIIAILRQPEGGVPPLFIVKYSSRENAPFYKWRAKRGGMDESVVSPMKAMG